MPVGPGRKLFGWSNGFNRQILGGWQISGMTTVQRGAPFTVYNSSNDYSGFNQFFDRPDVAGSGKLTQNNSNPDHAFDTTFFKTPPAGRVGNSGRDPYYGPGLVNFDFAGAKSFALGTERVRLQFRADLFNLFNHTNFSNPVSNQSDANFGKITSAVGSAVATAVGTTAGPVGGGPPHRAVFAAPAVLVWRQIRRARFSWGSQSWLTGSAGNRARGLDCLPRGGGTDSSRNGQETPEVSHSAVTNLRSCYGSQ